MKTKPHHKPVCAKTAAEYHYPSTTSPAESTGTTTTDGVLDTAEIKRRGYMAKGDHRARARITKDEADALIKITNKDYNLLTLRECIELLRCATRYKHAPDEQKYIIVPSDVARRIADLSEELSLKEKIRV